MMINLHSPASDSADTEASQPAEDITDKCDLEILQSSFWMIARRIVEQKSMVKKLFVQHNAVLPS